MTLLKKLFAREPDFIVGGKENPYLYRWWIIPRNPIFNIYLHKFIRDDDDRALHDHPWASLSIAIINGYMEWMPHKSGAVICRHRKRWSIVFRKATHRHRIQLYSYCSTSARRPAWTIFITGPRLREWGFWPKDNAGKEYFVHWKDFTDPDDPGLVRKETK